MNTKKLFQIVSIFMIAALALGFLPMGAVKAMSSTLCVNPGGTAGCYTTIQAAIEAAASGDTITVAVGTYAENVIVNKSVNLRGAQAGIDPRSAFVGGPGTRDQASPSGETVVIPGIKNLTAGNIFTVQANNVTIDGFWIDGSNLGGANPSLTPGMGLTVGSTEVFAIHAIYNGDDNTSTYATITGAVFQNNIAKNFADLGISVFNNRVSVSHDNLITHNFVTNLNGPGVYGPPAAISILYDGYSSVIENEVTNSVLGIYTENNHESVLGMSVPVISGNDVSSIRAGIWHNSTNGNAPTFTISDNTIRTWDPGVGHVGEYNVGLFLSTIMGTAQVNISNNTILPGAFRGIQVIWATAGLTIHGGSVSGARDTGILLYNKADASVPGLGNWGSAGQPTTVTLDGVSVTGSGTGVRVWDNGGGKNVTMVLNGSTISTGTTGLLVDGALATMTGHLNRIMGNTGGVVNNTSTSINLDKNWWGNASGPGGAGSGSGDTVSNNVVFSPYCMNVGCTTFATSGASIQAAISTAPFGTTITIPAGTYNQPGGFAITNPGVTIILSAGAIIQNSSPCFVIAANDTTITGVGKCVPTNTSDGIVVNAGVQRLVIDGIEIDGSITGGTGDGIHFNGNVTDLQILDAYIHNLPGDGIDLGTGSFAGVFQVAGNFFKANAGLGVNNGGTSKVLSYNNWDTFTAPGTGANGYNGIVGDVTPWTYAQGSTSSNVPPSGKANKVMVGENITYTFQLKPQEVWGADYEMAFDNTKLAVVSVTCNNTVFNFTCKVPTAPDANTAGSIHFVGTTTGGGLSVDGTVTYTVVFTGKAAGTSVLDLKNESFATFNLGPTMMVYSNGMTDGLVTVFANRTVTGTLLLQGRETNIGATFALGTGPLGYGPYSGVTDYWGAYTLISVVDDTYQVSAHEDLYLSVTTAVTAVSHDPNIYYVSNKSVITNASKVTIAVLTLLGGDVNNDNAIDVTDASGVGGAYGSGNPLYDINADGIVNLLDLAMVGGNYDKTSATAYASWTP